MSLTRRPKNAPKDKDGKGTGGQFTRDLSGSDPRNIPTAADLPSPPAAPDGTTSFDYDRLERMRATLTTTAPTLTPSSTSVSLLDSMFPDPSEPTPQQIRHQEALEAKNLPQRITHEEPGWGPDSTGYFTVMSYGYDPGTGRLEVLVEDSGTDTPETVLYAYRGVSTEEYKEFRYNPCQYWEENIMDDPYYAYENADEAAIAGVADRCDDCGQYRGVFHACPAIEFPYFGGTGRWSSEIFGLPYRDKDNPASPYIFPEDKYNVPTLDNIEAALANSTNIRYVELDVQTSMRSEPYGVLNGIVRYSRNDAGGIHVDISRLQCSCRNYRSYGECMHVSAFRMIAENGLDDTVSGISDEQRNELIRILETNPQTTSWIDDPASRAEAFALHQPDTDISYSHHPEAFLRAMEQERARQASLWDEDIIALPYRTENVLDGLCTRESGQGFGVEIEYEFPEEWTREEREAANERIGQQLYAAGLTYSDEMQPYGTASHNGYPDTHTDSNGRGTWSWEHDGSVDGELVTPTMYDEPETWIKLALALKILQANGAIAGMETGAHVHVGTGNYKGSPAAYTELMRIVNQHEDSIVRLATNPTRGRHRNNNFASPLSVIPPQGFATISSAKLLQETTGGRESIINLKNCLGGRRDHAEFRIFDGSLDPGTTQANILLAVGTVEAARRNAEAGGTTRGKEPWGSGRDRQDARTASGNHELYTPEEIADDTRILRSFIDTICRRGEDKAQLAAVVSHASWSDSPYRA